MDVIRHVSKFKDGTAAMSQDRETNVMKSAEICLKLAMRLVRSMIQQALFALVVRALDLDVHVQEGGLQQKTLANVVETELRTPEKHVTSLLRQIHYFRLLELSSPTRI